MSDEKNIPKHYRRIMEKHPQLVEMHTKLADAARQDGPLDTKTGHLIQLAAAASIRSEGAVHSHARRALEEGATKQEIRQVILLLATTVGFPTVAAALDWLNDII